VLTSVLALVLPSTAIMEKLMVLAGFLASACGDIEGRVIPVAPGQAEVQMAHASAHGLGD